MFLSVGGWITAQPREHLCAQYLVGGITLPVFHRPTVAGREEDDAVLAEYLCEVVIEISGLVGILQHEDHGTMQLPGYGSEEERCRRRNKSLEEKCLHRLFPQGLYQCLCLWRGGI